MFVNELMPLASIVLALIIGTMSPGPSFVIVARTAVSKSRSHGLCAALGMGFGGMVFAGMALLGLQGVLLTVPSLYIALKVFGGIYLCFLGYRIYRSAREPLEFGQLNDNSMHRTSGAFLIGLVTQVSNPKTAIVYASVFAAFLPISISPILGISILLSVFAVEAGWYSIVAVLLSARKPRGVYLAFKAWIDRTAGLIMGALGVKLVTSSTVTAA